MGSRIESILNLRFQLSSFSTDLFKVSGLPGSFGIRTNSHSKCLAISRLSSLILKTKSAPALTALSTSAGLKLSMETLIFRFFSLLTHSPTCNQGVPGFIPRSIISAPCEVR